MAELIAITSGTNQTLFVEEESSAALIVSPQAQPVLIGTGVPGGRGQQGIPGPAGGSAFQRMAGVTLSALRILYESPNGSVYPLDHRDAAHIDLLLGLSLSAALSNTPVTLQRTGVIDDAGWSWIPGNVWLGTDGQLTQTPPAEGFDVLIGTAVSATRLTLNIQAPIDLQGE